MDVHVVLTENFEPITSYRPHTEYREGDVFTDLCHSVQEGYAWSRVCMEMGSAWREFACFVWNNQ